MTDEGAVIIRRYDLNDEEKHRQMEREIFEEPKSAEEKLRTGDPAASLEIVSKAKAKAASSEAASSSSGIAQVIGDTVGQFIKPKTRDQAHNDFIQEGRPQLPGATVAEDCYDFNRNGDISYVVSEAESAADAQEHGRFSQA